MRTLTFGLLAASLLLTACPKEGDSGDATDADGDGWAAWEDCNDRDPMIHPEAMETCDGRDNDCDDEVDEGATTTLYRDADLDGYGDPATTTTGCVGTGGYASTGDDCDDGDATVHPDAEEWCDGLDNDCDDEVDEDVEVADWFADMDADGFGDPDNAVTACLQPDGFIADNTDCDDGDPAINPDADERCDSVDNDCDGDTDEGDALDAVTWYPDSDGDGFGDLLAAGTDRCAGLGGEVQDNTDCDDSSASVNPDATEVCDDAGTDEDCDGLRDDDDDSTDPFSMSVWYQDSDRDGYGDPRATTRSCLQPPGTTSDGSDCDDTDTMINPAMDEICNGDDDDCDGLTDDADPSVTDAGTWYTDADGDGYGDAASPIAACSAPKGAVRNSSDCDDTDPTLTTDCSGDTGDTGMTFTRDGTYEGTLEIVVVVSSLGITDTCVGTATIEVDEVATTQLSGTGGCVFLGTVGTLLGAQTGILEGAITVDPAAEGTVAVGSGGSVIISDDWVGEFTDDDTLYGEFDGTVVYTGIPVAYAGTFEVAR